MAHKVNVTFHAKPLAYKDLKVEIQTDEADERGKFLKLGTLLISQGNVEWLPKGNSVNRKQVTWAKLASLLDKYGTDVKKK